MDKACERCMHWQRKPRMDPDKVQHMGDCRRRAPTAPTSTYFYALAVWPATASIQWCGEFEDAGEGQP